jgi:hypothetical protein
LALSINLHNINYDLIKSNSDVLYKIFVSMKQYWINAVYTHEIIGNKTDEYINVMQIITNSLIADYNYVKNKIKEIKQIIKIKQLNLSFYYLDIGNYNQDIQLINKLFNESLCLLKFSKNINNDIVIIWLPILKNRDWNFPLEKFLKCQLYQDMKKYQNY